MRFDALQFTRLLQFTDRSAETAGDSASVRGAESLILFTPFFFSLFNYRTLRCVNIIALAALHMMSYHSSSSLSKNLNLTILEFLHTCTSYPYRLIQINRIKTKPFMPGSSFQRVDSPIDSILQSSRSDRFITPTFIKFRNH